MHEVVSADGPRDTVDRPAWRKARLRAAQASSVSLLYDRSAGQRFFRRRRRMTGHATPDAAPNTTDLFEIMRTAAGFRTASWSYRTADGPAARNRSGGGTPS